MSRFWEVEMTLSPFVVSQADLTSMWSVLRLGQYKILLWCHKLSDPRGRSNLSRFARHLGTFSYMPSNQGCFLHPSHAKWQPITVNLCSQPVKRHAKIWPARQKTNDAKIGHHMKGWTLCQKETLPPTKEISGLDWGQERPRILLQGMSSSSTITASGTEEFSVKTTNLIQATRREQIISRCEGGVTPLTS